MYYRTNLNGQVYPNSIAMVLVTSCTGFQRREQIVIFKLCVQHTRIFSVEIQVIEQHKCFNSFLISLWTGSSHPLGIVMNSEPGWAYA